MGAGWGVAGGCSKVVIYMYAEERVHIVALQLQQD